MKLKIPRSRMRRVTIYRERGVWRWRLQDYYNGKVTAASSESFVRRDQAIKSLAVETGIDLENRATWHQGRWRRLEVTVWPGLRSFVIRGASSFR